MMDSKEPSVDIQEDEADCDLPQVGLRMIREATNNFSEDNKLGEGGFGPVYKVTGVIIIHFSQLFIDKDSKLRYKSHPL